MSDNATNKFAKESDVFLSADVDGLGFYHSYIAPMLIAEIISINLGRRIGPKKSRNRMETIESFVQESELLAADSPKKEQILNV